VTAEGDKFIARQDFLELLFTFEQRKAAKAAGKVT
jgi:hypothetical protein